MVQTDVLVVGGGPVGLAAALGLGRLGVAVTLVERHPGAHPHPRARSINVRTCEIFASWGVLADIEKVCLPPAWAEHMIFCRTLAEPEVGRVHMNVQGTVDGVEHSPYGWLLSAQDLIEPVLRRHAESLPGADLRFSTSLVGFDQDGDGVTAQLVDADGASHELRAKWMIGADGAGSAVRRALGVPLDGQDEMAYLVNTYFRADLGPWTEHRPAVLYWTTKPARNVFQKIDAERWQCQILYSRDEYQPQDFDRARAADWIRASVGVDDLDVDVVNAIPWTMASAVAERFRVGRVLLAGDAAHQVVPTGGFGMNTGIQDSWNLACKLAAVLGGTAGEALLDTYHEERWPIAQEVAAWALRNSGAVGAIRRSIEGGASAADLALVRGYTNFAGADLGMRAPSGAFVDDGSAAVAVDDPMITYVSDARPGQRAPHLWLDGPAGRSSILDLYGQGFVLVVSAGGRADEWDVAARTAGVDVAVHRVVGAASSPGPAPTDWSDAAGELERRYRVGSGGAVLVRPDGVVAARWSTAPPAPTTALAEAVRVVLRR